MLYYAMPHYAILVCTFLELLNVVESRAKRLLPPSLPRTGAGEETAESSPRYRSTKALQGAWFRETRTNTRAP